MRRTLPIVLAAALALTACGAEQTAGESTGPADGAAEEAAFGEGAVEHEFDQPYTYDDGLTVIVEAPSEYTPRNEAIPDEPPPAFVTFTMRVENGTDSRFELSQIEAQLQSAGEDQEQFLDPDGGTRGIPEQELISGGAQTFHVVFGAADLDDVALLISPGDGRDPLLLTP